MPPGTRERQSNAGYHLAVSGAAQRPFLHICSAHYRTAGEDGVQVRLIDQGKDTPQVDAYWMRCAPRSLRHAEAHTVGTRESLTLISGWLAAGPEGATTQLRPGDTITFAADQPHLYRTQETGATLMMTITYGIKGETP